MEDNDGRGMSRESGRSKKVKKSQTREIYKDEGL